MKKKILGRVASLLLTVGIVALSTSCWHNEEPVEFFEPLALWGVLPEAVEGYMTDYSLYESSDEQLLYNGKGMVYRYLYHFKDGKLDYSVLSVEKEHGQALVDFIEAKYEYVGYTEEGSFVYATANRNMAINLVDGENLVMAIYSPFPEK